MEIIIQLLAHLSISFWIIFVGYQRHQQVQHVITEAGVQESLVTLAFLDHGRGTVEDDEIVRGRGHDGDRQ